MKNLTKIKCAKCKREMIVPITVENIVCDKCGSINHLYLVETHPSEDRKSLNKDIEDNPS